MEQTPEYKEKTEVVQKGSGWHKRPSVIIIGVFYLLLMVLLFAGGKSAPEVFPAPDFSIENIMGPGEVALSDFKGSPIIIYFFASW